MAPSIQGYTSVDDALSRVRAELRGGMRIETVPTSEAYARISAEDIVASADVPPVSQSHMDGFAVIAEGLRNATRSQPGVLKIVDTTGPGMQSKHHLKRGEAVQVATGARLPSGADAVVPIESVEFGGKTLYVGFAPEAGAHVYMAGEDFHRGELVVAKGHAIRAQDIGMLIALGFTKTMVWKRPRMSVIATGSELTSATKPEAGKVIDSHSPVFLRLGEVLGCISVDLGIVGDEPRKMAKAIRKALGNSDFVVTLGGTSSGKHDLVMDVISSLRPDVLVHGLRMDRGRVTGVASVGGKPVLMMPGPIQAAMNAFLLLGIPFIETLAGGTRRALELPCTLSTSWESRPRFSVFQKVVYVRLRPGKRNVAEPLGGETESIRVLAQADGYIVVPEDVKKVDAGSRVQVRLVPGFSSIW